MVVAVLDDDLMLPCMERFIVDNGGYGGSDDDKNGMGGRLWHTFLMR